MHPSLWRTSMTKKKIETFAKPVKPGKVPDSVEILEHFLDDVNIVKAMIKKSYKIQAYSITCLVTDPKDNIETFIYKFDAIDFLKLIGVQELAAVSLKDSFLEQAEVNAG